MLNATVFQVNMCFFTLTLNLRLGRWWRSGGGLHNNRMIERLVFWCSPSHALLNDVVCRYDAMHCDVFDVLTMLKIENFENFVIFPPHTSSFWLWPGRENCKHFTLDENEHARIHLDVCACNSRALGVFLLLEGVKTNFLFLFSILYFFHSSALLTANALNRTGRLPFMLLAWLLLSSFQHFQFSICTATIFLVTFHLCCCRVGDDAEKSYQVGKKESMNGNFFSIEIEKRA